jgi:hypothetical protein
MKNGSGFVMSPYDAEVGKLIGRSVHLHSVSLRLKILELIESEYILGGPQVLDEIRRVVDHFEQIVQAIKRFERWDSDMIRSHGELYYRAMNYTTH